MLTLLILPFRGGGRLFFRPQKNGVKKITEYGWRLRSRSKGKAV